MSWWGNNNYNQGYSQQQYGKGKGGGKGYNNFIGGGYQNNGAGGAGFSLLHAQLQIEKEKREKLEAEVNKREQEKANRAQQNAIISGVTENISMRLFGSAPKKQRTDNFTESRSFGTTRGLVDRILAPHDSEESQPDPFSQPMSCSPGRSMIGRITSAMAPYMASTPTPRPAKRRHAEPEASPRSSVKKRLSLSDSDGGDVNPDRLYGDDVYEEVAKVLLKSKTGKKRSLPVEHDAWVANVGRSVTGPEVKAVMKKHKVQIVGNSESVHIEAILEFAAGK